MLRKCNRKIQISGSIWNAFPLGDRRAVLFRGAIFPNFKSRVSDASSSDLRKMEGQGEIVRKTSRRKMKGAYRCVCKATIRRSNESEKQTHDPRSAVEALLPHFRGAFQGAISYRRHLSAIPKDRP